MERITNLVSKDVYAVWFSASYCRWCTEFTVKLEEFARESKIPIILCGSDKTKDSYDSYSQKNNWTTPIPFDDNFRITLREIYNIQTIPALIFFNKQLVIEREGRHMVQQYNTQYVLDQLYQSTNYDSDEDF